MIEASFLTLSQLSDKIKRVLSTSSPHGEWVQAEILSLSRNPISGHYYLELIEKTDSELRAKMKGIIWASNYYYLNEKFKAVTRESLSKGIKIFFRAKFNYHSEYGLSLDLIDIEPSFTLGDMMRQRRQTVERLRQENIFDLNKKLPFPLLPQRLAIISSEIGKGYADFIIKLTGTTSQYTFVYNLFPSLLQGDGAIHQITEQLGRIKQRIHQFDVVAIIRGGGDDAGLQCYDSYELAKEIATFPIPVLTGIGHSTNETVVDMVAHVKKITPTDLAFYLIEKFDEINNRIEKAQNAILRNLSSRLQGEQEHLLRLRKSIANQAHRIVNIEKVALSSIVRNFVRSVSAICPKIRAGLDQKSTNLKYKPGELIRLKKQELQALTEGLSKMFKHAITISKLKVHEIEKDVRNKSPKTILARGYSITFHNGKSLKDYRAVKEGDVLHTQLFDGEIVSNVQKDTDG